MTSVMSFHLERDEDEEREGEEVEERVEREEEQREAEEEDEDGPKRLDSMRSPMTGWTKEMALVMPKREKAMKKRRQKSCGMKGRAEREMG